MNESILEINESSVCLGSGGKRNSLGRQKTSQQCYGLCSDVETLTPDVLVFGDEVFGR